MTLEEISAAFVPEGLGRVVFVLDASESAAPVQQAIATLAREVLAALPAGVERALYFLGNATAYPWQQLEGQDGRWFEENRGRASLVTPVWERLALEEPATIVVIGAGRIFDLADWAGTPLAERALLVSMGQALQDDPVVGEELVEPGPVDLLRRLHDPVTGVEISGPGFMPLWWDRPGYRLRLAGGRAALVGEELDDYGLNLRFVAPPEAAVRAHLSLASGRQREEPLRPVEGPIMAPVQKGTLPPEEAEILFRAIAREPFTCPHCGRPHPWDTRRCLAGAPTRGRVVYPSLQADERGDLAVFYAGSGPARFRLYPGPVLPLGPGTVVVQEGRQALLYRYDQQEGRWWCTEETLAPYQAVGRDRYVVFL